MWKDLEKNKNVMKIWAINAFSDFNCIEKLLSQVN